MKKYDSRSADKFVVRMPDGMRERVMVVANANHRSMNSEIISRLESTLKVEADDGTLGLRIDSPELTAQELQLLKSFRQMGKRQQNAMVSLIAVEPETEN